VVSPESQQALGRKRVKLGMKALFNTIQENKAQGISQYQADRIDKDINSIETLLDEIMMLYSQQLRAAALLPTCRQALARDKLYADTCIWLRDVRSQNGRTVKEAAPPPPAAPLPAVLQAEHVSQQMPEAPGGSWPDRGISGVLCRPELLRLASKSP